MSMSSRCVGSDSDISQTQQEPELLSAPRGWQCDELGEVCDSTSIFLCDLDRGGIPLTPSDSVGLERRSTV